MGKQASTAVGTVAADDSKKYVSDFLGLPDCKTLRHDQVEHILFVRTMYTPQIPGACPFCGGAWKHEPKYTVLVLEPFWDIPRGSSPVLVQLMVPRITCSKCKLPLNLTLAWLHATRKMTYRLEDYILDRSATLSTFTQIALDTGQDLNTVIDIFLTAFRQFDKKRSKDLPRVLQIDEVYFHGRYYTILVNAETGTVVDLLLGRKNKVILARLMEARNREAVEYVLQDYHAPFRDVTTKPVTAPFKKSKKKNKKKEGPANAGAEPSTGETFETPLFGELPRVDASDPGENKYTQLPPGALAAQLPNAKTVGDHYHLSQMIEKCFDKLRTHVQEQLPSFFFSRIMKDYTREKIRFRGWEAVEAEAKAKADQLAKARAKDLTQNKGILFKHPDELNDHEHLWLDEILADHPLLKKGWEAKNRGLDIFPRKPPAGRSKKARKVAAAKRIGQLMDDEEAGKRLDEWVVSIDAQMQQYFKRVINLIARWREEIKRIGTTGFSNANAESKNRYLRMLEAISRGLSFELMRARLLWADTHSRTNRWPTFCEEEEGKITVQRFVELADAMLERERAAARTGASPAEAGARPGLEADVPLESNHNDKPGLSGPEPESAL